MRTLACCCFLAMSVTSVAAQAVQVDRIEVLEYGTYSGTVQKIEPRAGTLGVSTTVDRQLIEQTETVKATLGARFGIRYIVRGRPNGRHVMLTYITRFPPAGIVNDKGERLAKSEFQWEDVIGKKSIRTYTLGETRELVPGDWSLEFYYQGRKIGEKRFKVVLP